MMKQRQYEMIKPTKSYPKIKKKVKCIASREIEKHTLNARKKTCGKGYHEGYIK